MTFMIPDYEMEGALVARDDGTGRYGLYKEAGAGWNGGFIVVTKASQRAKRRTKWVATKAEAEEALDKFFPW